MKLYRKYKLSDKDGNKYLLATDLDNVTDFAKSQIGKVVGIDEVQIMDAFEYEGQMKAKCKTYDDFKQLEQDVKEYTKLWLESFRP